MPGQTNPYETKPIADVLSELKVQSATGLSDEEVKQLQTTYGLNEVAEKKQLTVLLFLTLNGSRCLDVSWFQVILFV